MLLKPPNTLRLLYTLWFMLFGVTLFAQAPTYSPFDLSYIHEIRIGYGGDDFHQELSSSYKKGSKDYFEASLRIDDYTFRKVGIRQKGTLSNQFAFTPKKPLKIKLDAFHDEYELQGMEKFNLANAFEDPSYLRDVASLYLFNKMHVPAPRASWAKVFVNGHYHGLFILIEQVDKDFLKNHYDDNDGNLYEVPNAQLYLKNGQALTGDKYFELKTNEKKNQRFRLAQFIRFIHESHDSTFVDSLDYYLHLKPFLTAIAIDLFIWQSDGMVSGSTHNFRLYFDHSKGRFEWIPWDYNMAWGYGLRDEQFSIPSFDAPEQLLLKRICENEALYKALLQQLMAVYHEVHSRAFKRKLKSWHKMIADAVKTAPHRFFSYEQYKNSLHSTITGGMNQRIPGLMAFLNTRRKSLKHFLKAEGLKF